VAAAMRHFAVTTAATCSLLVVVAAAVAKQRRASSAVHTGQHHVTTPTDAVQEDRSAEGRTQQTAAETQALRHPCLQDQYT